MHPHLMFLKPAQVSIRNCKTAQPLLLSRRYFLLQLVFQLATRRCLPETNISFFTLQSWLSRTLFELTARGSLVSFPVSCRLANRSLTRLARMATLLALRLTESRCKPQVSCLLLTRQLIL